MYAFATNGEQENNNAFSPCSRVMMDNVIAVRGQGAGVCLSVCLFVCVVLSGDRVQVCVCLFVCVIAVRGQGSGVCLSVSLLSGNRVQVCVCLFVCVIAVRGQGAGVCLSVCLCHCCQGTGFRCVFVCVIAVRTGFRCFLSVCLSVSLGFPLNSSFSVSPQDGCFLERGDNCGNGVVDEGEVCDCGFTNISVGGVCGNDPCCNGTTCAIADNMECR